MAILDIHFHDSKFALNIGSGSSADSAKGRKLSLPSGKRSERTKADGGTTDRPSLAPKLKSFAFLAVVVGAGVAYNKLQARRARAATEGKSSGRRLSLSRSK